MTLGEHMKSSVIKTQIIQLESRIEELRLETIPDVEAIRNLQSNLHALRLELARLTADEILFFPV